MFRFGAQRVVRPLAQTPVNTLRPTQHVARFNSKQLVNGAVASGQRTKPMALAAYRANTALIRSYASGPVPGTTRLGQMESEFKSATVAAAPSLVSSSSSIHPAFGEVGTKDPEPDPDMMAGVKSDLKVIKEVFAMKEVPKEALNIGLAGVVPYLATSITTVFCAFEISTAAKYGTGYFFSEAGAEALLHFLEPLQVGYGAVILSCLGTIHWGLEWAGYGGRQGYRRYAIGVLAPAVAWPTIMMPVEYALISQFLSFNLLYAMDSTAAVRGWVPPWYSTYRFILTFIVGASIVVSLIGRGMIQDRIGEMPTATQRLAQMQELGLVTKKNKDEKANA